MDDRQVSHILAVLNVVLTAVLKAVLTAVSNSV